MTPAVVPDPRLSADVQHPGFLDRRHDLRDGDRGDVICATCAGCARFTTSAATRRRRRCRASTFARPRRLVRPVRLDGGSGGDPQLGRFGTASYEAGQGLELVVHRECVIGGAALIGGQGTVLGAFLGVILVQCIKTGLVQIGADVDIQNIIVGAGVVILVAIDIVLAKRRQGRA